MIFIKEQLYILKKQYPGMLDIYSVVNGPTNLETGEKTIIKTKYHIKNAVIMPVSLTSNPIFTSAFMKNVGREFAYGNIIDFEIKKAVIDRKDLPKTFDIRSNNYVVIDHARFEMMRIQELPKNLGYQLDLKRAVGVPANEIFEMKVNQNLRIIERQICQ